MDQEKRKLRQEKRAIKKAGKKRNRQQLKRGLRDDPEEAHRHEEDYGKYRSSSLNGLDEDATRRKDERSERET